MANKNIGIVILVGMASVAALACYFMFLEVPSITGMPHIILKKAQGGENPPPASETVLGQVTSLLEKEISEEDVLLKEGDKDARSAKDDSQEVSDIGQTIDESQLQ